MDTAAMLEAGVGRFRGPSMAALVAEMWAPLAVALAAMATLPSLMRRLQMLILRLRSRGKEVISSHISTYYSSGDDDDSESDLDDDDDEESSSGEDDDGEEIRRIGYYDGAADDGCFPWGGAVVRTWQGLPRRFSAAGTARFAPAPSPGTAGAAAIRLWGASTASGESNDGAWWDADEGGRGASSAAEAQAPVVVAWRRDNAAAPRRRRLAAVLPSPK